MNESEETKLIMEANATVYTLEMHHISGEPIIKLIKAYNKIKQDNLEYEKVLDVFDEREYRNKYLKERRKEEPGLLYPDADEIYKRYYEVKADYERTCKSMLELNSKLNKLEKKNKELDKENADLVARESIYIPRRRVRRIYKQLKKILMQDFKSPNKGCMDEIKKFINEIEKTGTAVGDQKIKSAIEYLISISDVED